MHTGKHWNPKDFKLNRSLIFLAKGHWERKVAINGQVHFYGIHFSVGIAYKHQIVSIQLDARKKQWKVFDTKGKLLKSIAVHFSERSLWLLDYS